MKDQQAPIIVSQEVRDAIACNAPVVALESSIFAQGFPPPDNRTLAHEMAAVVRAAGALPAATAVIDGVIRVGLDEDAVCRLTEPGAAVIKCSARDLGVAVARGCLGATTVAATARIAAMVAIPIFATGGIGGVHHGAPLDVSADLLTLSRSPVAVVSSGAKSILDLPATFEALGALGVPVIGFACDQFPAFHSPESGIRLSHRVETASELVAILKAHWALHDSGGVLVCNPVPADAAIARGDLDALIDLALREARAAGIRGDGVTPYVLAALNRLSEGRTIKANRALALSNAARGAEIAVAWCNA